VPYNLRIVALDDRLRDVLERARAEVRDIALAEVDEVRRSAELSTGELRASAVRLADAIRAIDEAPTLGAVLTVVSGCARLDAGRAGIVLVNGAKGEALTAHPSGAEVPPEQARLVRRAVEDRAPIMEDESAAFPLLLGGHPVAVLITASPATQDIHNALDLLVRHASRVLEAMTVCRITGLTASPAEAEASAGT
jgi:hypothetical protein